MALQNLNRDLEAIFKTVINRGKYRSFFAKYSHEFLIDFDTAVDQLKEITPSAKRATPGYVNEFGLEKNVLQGLDKEIKETAQALINNFISIVPQVKNETPFKKPYRLGGNKGDKKLIVFVDLEKPGDQDAYSLINKIKVQVANKVFSKGNPGYILYERLLAAGRVKKEKSGQLPSNLYNVGHTTAIGKYKNTVFKQGTDQALEGVEGGEFIGDVRSKVADRINQYISDNGITISATDDFVVFKNGQLIQNPQSKLVIKTDLETQYSNQVKDNQQTGSGTAKSAAAQNRALRSLTDEIRDIVRVELEKTGISPERKGSDSFLDSIAKGIVLSPILVKKYANRTAINRTRFKGIKKNRKNVSKNFKDTKTKGRRTIHNVFSAGLANKKAVIKNKGKPEEKGYNASKDNLAEAMIARAFINQRLSGQVIGNMGRPSLENRSGRFAGSVNIVNAVSNAGVTHFDYTYQQNPYRAFERGGEYSPNYDPRQLIEKSIRELALQKLDTKFTLRRV